ncbi:response regulator receiver modulated diguanylate cyclase [Candidatus Magnetomorum sp. HK-1]|nr:response regulator receiver modulated diguanylate cyclase [Candidatus Magnetomorum sp. HK-1]
MKNLVKQILIADDDYTSRRLLEIRLNKFGYEVISTCDGKEAWDKINLPNSPNMIVLDWMMPGYTGVEICKKIRALDSFKERYKYVILLTARGAKEDIISGLDSGADDYLTKPFDDTELLMRIRSGRRILDLQEKLQYSATHDALTGILNRGAILINLEKEISRCKREKADLSIGLLDIDFFKSVNDTYGHLVGDEVLKEVTKRIQSCLRDYDLVGRYGGEEILIITPGAEIKQAVNIFERIRKTIGDTKMINEQMDVAVTASIGIASFSPEMNNKNMIKIADDALYKAKENGRNQICCFDL